MAKKRIAVYQKASDSKKWKILSILFFVLVFPVVVVTNSLVTLGGYAERVNYYLISKRVALNARIFWLFNWDGVREVDDD